MDSAFSPELFFKEATLDILIPNHVDADDLPRPLKEIVSAKQRAFAFYDEQLRVYLYICFPHRITGTGPEVISAIQSFCNQLDVHLESTIVDASQQQTSPILPRTSSKQQPQQQQPIQQQTPSSIPSSPKMGKRESGRPAEASVPFFSHTYSSRGKDPEPTVHELDGSYYCVYPLTIPIVYVKARGGQPLLSINFSVSYRPLPPSAVQKASSQDEGGDDDDAEYDVDLFETIDLLDGLRDDPIFSSDSERPVQRFMTETQTRQASTGPGIQTSHSNPQMLSLRRYIHETLPLRLGLIVKMRTTNASLAEKTVMMSVELENPVDAGCKFLVDALDIQVTNAVVSTLLQSESPFPLSMDTLDQMVFLYKVTILEDGAIKAPLQPQRRFQSLRMSTPAPPPVIQEDRVHPQRVSIQVYGTPVIDGVSAAPMRSKWNTILDVTGMRQRRDDGTVDSRYNSPYPSPPPMLARSHASLDTSVSVSPGAHSVGCPIPSSMDSLFGKRRMAPHPSSSLHQLDMGTRRATEIETPDGIIVSFTVPDTIVAGKAFALHIFIVNRSKHTRRFQVMIPNRKRQALEPGNSVTKTALPDLPAEQQPIDPFMDEGEFLRLYFENETHEADMICLENNVRLSALGPSTSQSVDIKFIAVKEKLHTIDLIQLVDQDTGFVTNLRHVLEIFVEQSDTATHSTSLHDRG